MGSLLKVLHIIARDLIVTVVCVSLCLSSQHLKVDFCMNIQTAGLHIFHQWSYWSLVRFSVWKNLFRWSWHAFAYLLSFYQEFRLLHLANAVSGPKPLPVVGPVPGCLSRSGRVVQLASDQLVCFMVQAQASSHHVTDRDRWKQEFKMP